MLRDVTAHVVKQWTYRPYVLNGFPTGVNTTIAVNFNFGQHTPAQP